jgi:hypothetical protein
MGFGLAQIRLLTDACLRTLNKALPDANGDFERLKFIVEYIKNQIFGKRPSRIIFASFVKNHEKGACQRIGYPL